MREQTMRIEKTCGEIRRFGHHAHQQKCRGETKRGGFRRFNHFFLESHHALLVEGEKREGGDIENGYGVEMIVFPKLAIMF
jgi:hypothetical protein